MADYIYIQQNTSEGAKIKYPSSAHPYATIATSGCGVCASLMALMNMTKYKYSLKAWTNKLLKNGCRAQEGTDMMKTTSLLTSSFGFKSVPTTNETELVSHLKKGYGAILNVGAKGYFSSSGHYVYAAGVKTNGELIILDPYYYKGKYTSIVRGIDRSKYFRYNSDHTLNCRITTVVADRAGYYYLLTPTKKISKPAVKSKYTDGVYKLVTNMIVRKGAGTNFGAKQVKSLTVDGKKNATSKNPKSLAVLKSGTKVTAKVIRKTASEYWLKTPSGYVCLEKGGEVYAVKII